MLPEVVRGSGDVETREVALGEVTEVDIGSALDAEIVPGDEPSLTVRADDNLIDRVEISEAAPRVEVRLERGITLRGVTAEVTVTVPSLTEVAVSGASSVEVAEGIDIADLRVSASGASELTGTVEADQLDVDASGSSEVVLDGSAGELRVSASGATDADLGGLAVDGDARVEASGASDVFVRVTGTLDAHASGASSVDYAGSPADVSARTSGASSVERRD